ncbi:hypothetical protein ONZ45_g18318 [Pleurotus djamor]|nr:hypothetical protein ONZ45_g18318 [Pleurotus djamor]
MMSFDFEFGEFVPCPVNDDTPLEVMACDRMRRALQKLKSAHQQTPGPSLFSSRRSSKDVPQARKTQTGFTWTSDELRQLSPFNPPSANKPTSSLLSFEVGGIESACEGYGFADSEDTCLRADSSIPVLTLDPRTDEEPWYLPFNDADIDFSSLYSVRDAFDATLKPLPTLKPNNPATSSVPNAPFVDDHTLQPQPTLEAVDLNTIDLTTACEAPRLLASGPSQRKRVKLDHGSSSTAVAENIPPVLQPQSTPLPKPHKRNQAQTATNSKTSKTEREIAVARSKGFIPIIVDGTQKVFGSFRCFSSESATYPFATSVPMLSMQAPGFLQYN